MVLKQLLWQPKHATPQKLEKRVPLSQNGKLNVRKHHESKVSHSAWSWNSLWQVVQQSDSGTVVTLSQLVDWWLGKHMAFFLALVGQLENFLTWVAWVVVWMVAWKVGAFLDQPLLRVLAGFSQSTSVMLQEAVGTSIPANHHRYGLNLLRSLPACSGSFEHTHLSLLTCPWFPGTVHLSTAFIEL